MTDPGRLRRGSVLMVVMLVLAVVMAVTEAVLERSARQLRSSHRLAQREAAQMRVQGLADRVAASGTWRTMVGRLAPGDGGSDPGDYGPGVRVLWRRLHPLVLELRVSAEARDGSGVATAEQRLFRIAPPRWPLRWSDSTGLMPLADTLSWDPLQTSGSDDPVPAPRYCDATRAPTEWQKVRTEGGQGPSVCQLRGVLLVDGPWELAGRWTVDGLVVVRGAIREQGGSLTVRGGLLTTLPVVDSRSVAVTPDRERVEMALALLGRLSRQPFQWRGSFPAIPP